MDRGCEAMALGDPSTVDLAGLTVIDVESNGVIAVAKDMRDAQSRAASERARRGAQVVKTTIPALRDSFGIWSSMMQSAAETSFSEILGDGRRVRVGVELLRWAVGRSQHTLPSLALAGMEGLAERWPARTRRFVEKGRILRREMIDLIGPRGLMLYPSYPTVAPRHYRPLMMRLNWTYTAILNALEFPATQVPLGLNRDGLPLGVQGAATPGNDHLTVAAALEFERALGGWVPPRG